MIIAALHLRNLCCSMRRACCRCDRCASTLSTLSLSTSFSGNTFWFARTLVCRTLDSLLTPTSVFSLASQSTIALIYKFTIHFPDFTNEVYTCFLTASITENKFGIQNILRSISKNPNNAGITIETIFSLQHNNQIYNNLCKQ